jgi:hypothetical protein
MEKPTMERKQMMSNPALMKTNGLLYKFPQPLSSSVNRTFKREYAQRQSYTDGDTIVFDINTGSSYIDPATCMLSFDIDVAVTGDTTGVTFGTGSAANIIQEIRILSKNGCEVDRTQEANVLGKIRLDYLYSVEGQKMLEMAGVGQTITVGTPTRMVIPLSLISGFFRPTIAGMKIPAGLMSGLRIEIITATPERALTRADGTSTASTYTIVSPELLMMCHDLNDPTQAVLMKESAETGLEYTFPAYFNTRVTSTQGTLNEQVKKAVSQCTTVFSTTYDVDGGVDDVTSLQYDGFKSIDGTDLTSFQFRVGSNYYPQQTVTDEVEAWYVSESAFCKTRDLEKYPSNVSLADYNTGGKYVVAHPLETDDRLNLSGIPLNNSSVLELRLTQGLATNRETHIWIEYVSVSRTFINRTSLKI